MATRRVTVSLPEELAEKLKEQAGDRSVSALVTDILEERLERRELDRLWADYLRDVGASESDLAEADGILNDLLGRDATEVA